MLRPFALALLLLPLACSGPTGQRVSPEEYATLPGAQPPIERRSSSDAAEDLSRRRQSLELEQAAWREEWAAFELNGERALRDEQRRHARAEEDLVLAEQELSWHDEFVAPLRLREANLALEIAHAERVDAEAELAALELLWMSTTDEEAPLAEQALDRARSLLRRAQLGEELAELRRGELLERGLPGMRRLRQRQLEDAQEEVVRANEQLERGPEEREQRGVALAAERKRLDVLARTLESEAATLARDGGWLQGGGT